MLAGKETPEEPASLPPKKDGRLPGLRWLCVFMIGFSAFLFATKPALNQAQMIFRIALLLLGIVGLIYLGWRRRL